MNLLKRQEIGSVAGIVTLVVFIFVGGYFKLWSLSAFLTNVPYFIIVSIIGLFLWGFRKRIDSWFNKIPKITINRENAQVTQRDGVTKRLGNPDYIQNGIQYYGNRSRLPLQELFLEAQKKIDMLAVTFHTLTTNEIQTIRDTLFRGVQITFVILDPNSQHVRNRDLDFHEGEEVKHHVDRSLHILCREKSKLPRLPHTDLRDYLVIKTYDNVIERSIIIIDNKLVKIEEHPKGSSPDYRQNSLAFEDDNKGFFAQYSTEYIQINSKNYECPSLKK
jgi:hypothetical protein